MLKGLGLMLVLLPIAASAQTVGGFARQAGIGPGVPIIRGAESPPLVGSWARSIEQDGFSLMGPSMAADPAGNVYLAGSIFKSARYDLGGGAVIKPQPVDSAFILKLSQAGKPLWVRTVAKASAPTLFPRWPSTSAAISSPSGQRERTGRFRRRRGPRSGKSLFGHSAEVRRGRQGPVGPRLRCK